MGFFDFLSGSSQDPSQQGLPPQHSSVARLLELAGGLTGLTPLAAAGYLADQGTVTKFNEAYWPKFKNQMAQAGVPQQKIDMLDNMPIQQRTTVANELYQAAITNVPKEPKYTAAMGPNGQEEFIDPLSGHILSTLPKGTYTQSFKPKSGSESMSELWQTDPTKAAQILNQQEQIRAKYAKQPRVDVNVNTPTPPGNFLPNPADGGKTSIAIEHDKTGNLSTRVVNVPFSTISGVTHPPKPVQTGNVLHFPKSVTDSYTVQISKAAPGAAMLTPIPGASGGIFSWPKEPMVYYNGKYFKKGPSGKWDTPVGQ